jgi:hypothetical protein
VIGPSVARDAAGWQEGRIAPRIPSQHRVSACRNTLSDRLQDLSLADLEAVTFL